MCKNPSQEKKEILKKIIAVIKHPFQRKNQPLLHTVEWIFILLAFFIVGFSIILSQENMPSVVRIGDTKEQKEQDLIQTAEDVELFTGETIPEPIDTTAWDKYQNKWYGFEIQHPDSWKNNTQYKTATEKSAVYETIYKFRKDGENSGGAFEGYDVKVYSVKKVPDIESTNDIHKKENAPEDMSSCGLPLEEVSIGSDSLYLQKVSIDKKNPCYEPAYFYSVTKENYIYNIVPAVGENGERFSEPEKETDKIFPEYKEAVKTFKIIPIVRPKPKPDPRIGVRRPVSAKLVNGKLVCAKKNDKPHKSEKKDHKPGHLDLECCLDPDETPNPWCTY